MNLHLNCYFHNSNFQLQLLQPIINATFCLLWKKAPLKQGLKLLISRRTSVIIISYGSYICSYEQLDLSVEKRIVSLNIAKDEIISQ